jgi:UPF0755 protein
MINKVGVRNLGLAFAFIFLMTLGLRGIAPGPRTAPDFDGSARGPEVVIHIDLGMTGSQVGEVLEREFVVKSALAYFRAAVANQESKRIAPGEHRIETRIPASEAVLQLLDPDRIVDLVRVRDGARLREVVDALVRGGFEQKRVSQAISKLKPPQDFKLGNVEGFLYPAFYSFPRGTTEEDALSAMLSRFQQSTRDLSWQYEDFSKKELLIISSLVESEGTPDIFAKVARVVYNRLEKGMKLQFDSTVHYVFDRRGEIVLSLKDTQVRNKYNTFVYAGLPPGPIGSPTRAAIEATLNPADGDWLYFVTVLPNETRFTSSYDEFLKYKAEYKRNYANGAFE